MVGQDSDVGLHGRVFYLSGPGCDQCMAADAFHNLVELRALAIHLRMHMANLVIVWLALVTLKPQQIE
jgi:hypothetical protein